MDASEIIGAYELLKAHDFTILNGQNGDNVVKDLGVAVPTTGSIGKDGVSGS